MPKAVPAVTLSANCTVPPLMDSAPVGNALVVVLVGSISSRPAMTVVPPVKVFGPLNVRVPLPLLTSDPPWPLMLPANIVVRGEETVSCPVPRVMDDPELPLKAPIVWLTPLRFSEAPVAIVTVDCEGSTELAGAGLGESDVKSPSI